jgi:hypothetical protein
VGVLDPFVVRAGRHRGDAHDRELAQQRIEFVRIEHHAPEPQPAREGALGVGRHAEDAQIGRLAEQLGHARLRLVGIEVREPGHGAVIAIRR